jgi:hypothetical protein
MKANSGIGWVDVHGAGSQRGDPKQGDPTDYPEGYGPQGDAIRIYNQVRMVRDGEATQVAGGTPPAAVIIDLGELPAETLADAIIPPAGRGAVGAPGAR